MSKLEVIEKGSIFIIKMPMIVDVAVGESVKEESHTWLLTPATTLVFDFSRVDKIESAAFPGILPFIRIVKKNKKDFFSIGGSDEIVAAIKAMGCDLIFNFAADLAEVQKKSKFLQKPKASFNVEYVIPFIEATQKTLEAQCSMPSTAGKIRIKTEQESTQIEIAGVLNLQCDQFSGSITICFSKSAFLTAYGNMVGEKPTEITPEIEDAAGELLNIIYGTAKSELNQKLGTNLKPALPTILTGEKMRIRNSRPQGATVVVPFEAEGGNFHIEIAFDSTQAREAA